jgi:hypothetical protein
MTEYPLVHIPTDIQRDTTHKINPNLHADLATEWADQFFNDGFYREVEEVLSLRAKLDNPNFAKQDRRTQQEVIERYNWLAERCGLIHPENNSIEFYPGFGTIQAYKPPKR